MKWLITLVGVAVVMVILRDVFHTLWHPTRHGGLSRAVMTGLWRLSTRLSPRWRATGLAGPLGMVVVIALWTLSVAMGWALVYWPHMPDAFTFASELEPSRHTRPVDALYVSLVNLATLGLGDIAPAAGWLRIVAPLEALVGFALLTATVSWVLGIYPALVRRRALALRLSQLRRVGFTSERSDSGAGAAVLDGLAADLARVSVDFLQYTESYYFHDGFGNASLARALDYTVDLAEQAGRSRHADVRAAGAVLATAVEDLAVILDRRFLHTEDTGRAVFRAYAREHGHR